MSINKSYDALIEEAKTSSCAQTLHNLSKSVDVNIRRAVARNSNTLSKTLEYLANDPVLNVSYMATLHPNCPIKKEFLDTSHPCVSCEKDEREMICVDCSILGQYYR